MHPNKKYTAWALGGLGLLIIAGGVYFGIREYNRLKLSHQATLADLEKALQENKALQISLGDEQYEREKIEAELHKLGTTLGTLEKLSQTDDELLKKYSKIFFLNENYVPAKLAEIDPDFTFDKDRQYQIQEGVYPHLKNLLSAAKDDDVDLLVVSAFRSFFTQESLKAGYKVVYGSGANQFSADQGYSEHQLGTTVDFTTPKLGADFSLFEQEPAYKWLTKNAYKYGFVLSYPKGNLYYKFEPWHWRFVGVELAIRLHDENKYFYDFDQRTIDTYLVNFFD